VTRQATSNGLSTLGQLDAWALFHPPAPWVWVAGGVTLLAGGIWRRPGTRGEAIPSLKVVRGAEPDANIVELGCHTPELPLGSSFLVGTGVADVDVSSPRACGARCSLQKRAL